MAVMVMYGRGSGVGVPIGDLRSKNNTCPGLSDASPEPTTTQCRLQSAVCPLTISFHCAAGSLAISDATVSALGPSAGVQLAEVVGDPPGGLHPHPAATRPRDSTTAINREAGMGESLRAPFAGSRPATGIGVTGRLIWGGDPLSSRELLLAVNTL